MNPDKIFLKIYSFKDKVHEINVIATVNLIILKRYKKIITFFNGF